MQSTEHYDHLSRIYFDIYADTVLGKRLEINFADISLAISNLNVLIEERECLRQPTLVYYMLGYKFYRLRSDIEQSLQVQNHIAKHSAIDDGDNIIPLAP